MTQEVLDYSLEMPPRMVSSCCNCGFLTDQDYVMPLLWVFMLFICTCYFVVLTRSDFRLFTKGSQIIGNGKGPLLQGLVVIKACALLLRNINIWRICCDLWMTRDFHMMSQLTDEP